MLQTNLILETIEKKQTVKVTFKDVTRSPMVGRFVSLPDHNQCWEIKMVRFVPLNKLEEFDYTKDVNCTKLHSFTNFQLITVCQ